jgi:SAM-dependent methyltransferase
MIMEDIELVRRLHAKYRFEAPAVDLGGLETPNVADYEVSVRKAVEVQAGGRMVKVPHEHQNDRYRQVHRPWSFIDASYSIINPEYGHPPIEALPDLHPNRFSLAIMVSVFEHVENPYKVSDAIFRILKPGGYLFNSTPFLFPYHPSPEDNFRFSPKALERIHASSGFRHLEGGFHAEYRSSEGVGDTNPARYLDPQAMSFAFALVRKPL